MAFTIYPCMLTENDCYRAGRTMTPKGIVVHSTGAENPYLRRYVQPDDGQLGKNLYGNHWNTPGLDVCVNAFIGRDREETVRCYQTLPWNMRPWGVGSGPNGSYNQTHIQFEICEDDHTDEGYCRACFEMAAQLCAYLCRRYDIPVQGIVSHHEAYLAGFGSGHIDPDNWWPKFGLSMADLRARVEVLLDQAERLLYRIRRTWEDAAGQLGAYASLERAIAACPEGYSVFDQKGKAVFTRKEESEMRYALLRDVTTPVYRQTLEKLIAQGVLKGRGGQGEELELDLSEDSVRLLVILDRAGVFG